MSTQISTSEEITVYRARKNTVKRDVNWHEGASCHYSSDCKILKRLKEDSQVVEECSPIPLIPRNRRCKYCWPSEFTVPDGIIGEEYRARRERWKGLFKS